MEDLQNKNIDLQQVEQNDPSKNNNTSNTQTGQQNDPTKPVQQNKDDDRYKLDIKHTNFPTFGFTDNTAISVEGLKRIAENSGGFDVNEHWNNLIEKAYKNVNISNYKDIKEIEAEKEFLKKQYSRYNDQLKINTAFSQTMQNKAINPYDNSTVTNTVLTYAPANNKQQLDDNILKLDSHSKDVIKSNEEIQKSLDYLQKEVNKGKIDKNIFEEHKNNLTQLKEINNRTFNTLSDLKNIQLRLKDKQMKGNFDVSKDIDEYNSKVKELEALNKERENLYNTNILESNKKINEQIIKNNKENLARTLDKSIFELDKLDKLLVKLDTLPNNVRYKDAVNQLKKEHQGVSVKIKNNQLNLDDEKELKSINDLFDRTNKIFKEVQDAVNKYYNAQNGQSTNQGIVAVDYDMLFKNTFKLLSSNVNNFRGSDWYIRKMIDINSYGEKEKFLESLLSVIPVDKRKSYLQKIDFYRNSILNLTTLDDNDYRHYSQTLNQLNDYYVNTINVYLNKNTDKVKIKLPKGVAKDDVELRAEAIKLGVKGNELEQYIKLSDTRPEKNVNYFLNAVSNVMEGIINQTLQNNKIPETERFKKFDEMMHQPINLEVTFMDPDGDNPKVKLNYKSAIELLTDLSNLNANISSELSSKSQALFQLYDRFIPAYLEEYNNTFRNLSNKFGQELIKNFDQYIDISPFTDIIEKRFNEVVTDKDGKIKDMSTFSKDVITDVNNALLNEDNKLFKPLGIDRRKMNLAELMNNSQFTFDIVKKTLGYLKSIDKPISKDDVKALVKSVVTSYITNLLGTTQFDLKDIKIKGSVGDALINAGERLAAPISWLLPFVDNLPTQTMRYSGLSSLTFGLSDDVNKKYEITSAAQQTLKDIYDDKLNQGVLFAGDSFVNLAGFIGGSLPYGGVTKLLGSATQAAARSTKVAQIVEKLATKAYGLKNVNVLTRSGTIDKFTEFMFKYPGKYLFPTTASDILSVRAGAKAYEKYGPKLIENLFDDFALHSMVINEAMVEANTTSDNLEKQINDILANEDLFKNTNNYNKEYYDNLRSNKDVLLDRAFNTSFLFNYATIRLFDGVSDRFYLNSIFGNNVDNMLRHHNIRIDGDVAKVKSNWFTKKIGSYDYVTSRLGQMINANFWESVGEVSQDIVNTYASTVNPKNINPTFSDKVSHTVLNLDFQAEADVFFDVLVGGFGLGSYMSTVKRLPLINKLYSDKHNTMLQLEENDIDAFNQFLGNVKQEPTDGKGRTIKLNIVKPVFDLTNGLSFKIDNSIGAVVQVNTSGPVMKTSINNAFDFAKDILYFVKRGLSDLVKVSLTNTMLKINSILTNDTITDRERVEKYADILHQSGSITDEEYEKIKTKLDDQEFIKSMLENAEEVKSYLINLKEFIENTEKVKKSTSKKVLDLLKSGVFGEEFKNMVEELENTSVEEFEKLGKESKGKLGQLSKINMFSNILSNLHLTLGLKNISEKDVEEVYIDDKNDLYIKYKEGNETKYIKVSMNEIDEKYQEGVLRGIENVTTSAYVVSESNEKEYKHNKDNRSKVYDSYKEATKNFTANLIKNLYDIVENNSKLSVLNEHLNYFLFDNIELKKPLTEDVIWYFKNAFNYKEVSDTMLKTIIDIEYEKPLKYYKSLLLINLYNNLVNENLLRSTVKYSINSRKEVLRKMLSKASIRIGDENISILSLLSKPQDLFNKIISTYLKNKEEIIDDVDIIKKMLQTVLNDLKDVKDKNETIEKNIEIIEDYIKNIDVVKKLLKDVDTINYEEKMQMLSDFFDKVISLATHINRIVDDNTLKSAIERLNDKLTNIDKAIKSTKGLLRLLEENSKVVEKKDKLLGRIGKRDSKNNTSFKELSISILQSMLMAVSSLTDVSDRDALERFKEEYKKSLRESIKGQLKDLGIQDDLILQETVDSFIRQLEEEGKIDEKIEELVVSFTSMLKDAKDKKAVKRFQTAFENIFASSLSAYYLKFIGGAGNSLKKQSLLKIIEKYIIPAALVLSKEISKGVVEILSSKEYKVIRGSFISENNNNVKVLSESDILNVRKKLEETLNKAFDVNSDTHKIILFMSKVLSQLGHWVLSDEVIRYANMSNKEFIDEIYELTSKDVDNTKQIEDIKKLIEMFLSETLNVSTVEDLSAFIELLSLGGISIKFNGVTINPKSRGRAFSIKQSEVKTLYELIDAIKEYSSYIYEDLYLFNNGEEYFKIPKELNSNNVLDYLNYKNTQLLAIYMLQLYKKTGEYNNLYEKNKTLEEMYAVEFNKRYREAYKQVKDKSKKKVQPKKEEDDKTIDKNVLYKIKEKAIELSGVSAKRIKDSFNLMFIYDRYFKDKLSFDKFYKLFLGFWNRFSSKSDEKEVAKNIVKVNREGEGGIVVGSVEETKDEKKSSKVETKVKNDTTNVQEKENKLQKINENFKGKKIRFVSFGNTTNDVFNTLNNIDNVHLIVDENENTDGVVMRSIVGGNKNILVVRKDETKKAIENNKTFESFGNIAIEDANIDYDIIVVVGKDLSVKEIRKVEEMANSGKTVYVDKSLSSNFITKSNVILYEDVADLLGAMINFKDLRLESITKKLDEKKNVLLRVLVLQELKQINKRLTSERPAKDFANNYTNLMIYLKLEENELFNLFKSYMGNSAVIKSILNKNDINIKDLYDILNEMYDSIKDKINSKDDIYAVIKENKEHINKKLDELESKRKKEEAKQVEMKERQRIIEKIQQNRSEEMIESELKAPTDIDKVEQKSEAEKGQLVKQDETEQVPYVAISKNNNVKPKNYVAPGQGKKYDLSIELSGDKQIYENVELDFNLDPTIKSILEEMHKDGNNFIIVGGAVRDKLFGVNPKDLDIEVYGHTTKQLVDRLRNYGVVELVGESFGVFKFWTIDMLHKKADNFDFKNVKPSIIVPIGISGSGKSTYVNELREKLGDKLVVISTDEIRVELLGDINDQSKNAKVFEIAKERIIKAIKEGKVVYYDATNVDTVLRNKYFAKIYNELADQGINIDLYYKVFEANIDESDKRIRKQIEKGENRANITRDILEKQYNKYVETVKVLNKYEKEIKEPYDFTLPRKEEKVGVGYKGFKIDVDPNLPIEKASERRDFTFNSMGYNPITKTLYDHFYGIRDMKEGVIRHVNDRTFVEDPLRILRAMQFQGRYGMVIAENTLHLIRKLALEVLPSMVVNKIHTFPEKELEGLDIFLGDDEYDKKLSKEKIEELENAYGPIGGIGYILEELKDKFKTIDENIYNKLQKAIDNYYNEYRFITSHFLEEMIDVYKKSKVGDEKIDKYLSILSNKMKRFKEVITNNREHNKRSISKGRKDFRYDAFDFKTEVHALSPERVWVEFEKWASKSKYHNLMLDFIYNSGLAGDISTANAEDMDFLIRGFFYEFGRLKLTPQDKIWHPEGDVMEHTMQVIAKMSEVIERESQKIKELAKASKTFTEKDINVLLYLSALLHDIAKPNTTKKYIDNRGMERIGARGHEEEGAKMLPLVRTYKDEFGSITDRMGIPSKYVDVLIPLVRDHLAHAGLENTLNTYKYSEYEKLLNKVRKDIFFETGIDENNFGSVIKEILKILSKVPVEDMRDKDKIKQALEESYKENVSYLSKKLNINEDALKVIGERIIDKIYSIDFSEEDMHRALRGIFNTIMSKLGKKEEDMIFNGWLLLYLMESDVMGRNNSNEELPKSIKLFRTMLEQFEKESKQKAMFKDLLSGDDIISLGFEKGKIIGDIKKDLKEKQIKGEINTIEEAIRYVKSKYADKLKKQEAPVTKPENEQTVKKEQQNVKEEQKTQEIKEKSIEERLKEIENRINENLMRLNNTTLTDKEKNEILNSINYLHKEKERLLSERTVSGKTIRQELEEKLKKLYDIIQVEHIDDLDSYIKNILKVIDEEGANPFVLFQIDGTLAENIVSFVISKMNDKDFENNRYFVELKDKSKGGVKVIREELHKDLSVIYENIVKPIIKELYGELSEIQKEELRKKLSAIDKNKMLKILVNKYNKELIDRMSEEDKDKLLKSLIEKYNEKLDENEVKENKDKVLMELIKKHKVDLSEQMSEEEKNNFFNEFFEKNVEEQYFYSYEKPIKDKERRATQALFWWFVNGGVRYQEVDGKIEVEDYDKYKEGVKVLNEKNIDPVRYAKPEEFISGKVIAEQRLKKVLNLDYVKVVDEREVDGKIYTVIQLDYDHESIKKVQIKKRFEGFTDDELRKAYAYREFMDIAVGKSFKNWCTCYIDDSGNITKDTVRSFLNYNSKHPIAHVFVNGKLKYGFQDEDTSLNLENGEENITINKKQEVIEKITKDDYEIEMHSDKETITYYNFDYEINKLVEKEKVIYNGSDLKTEIRHNIERILRDNQSLKEVADEFDYYLLDDDFSLRDKKTNKTLQLVFINRIDSTLTFKTENNQYKHVVFREISKSKETYNLYSYKLNIGKNKYIKFLEYGRDNIKIINVKDLLEIADHLFSDNEFYFDEDLNYVIDNTNIGGSEKLTSIPIFQHIGDSLYIRKTNIYLDEKIKQLGVVLDFINKKLEKYILNSKKLSFFSKDVELIGHEEGFKIEINREHIEKMNPDKEPMVINDILSHLEKELRFTLLGEKADLLRKLHIEYDEKQNIYHIDSDKVISYANEYIKEKYEEFKNKYEEEGRIQFQEKEGRVIGAAHLEAAKILIDKAYANDDTLPHEYAHFYIRWFYDTPIVQEAIRQFGGEEELVQSIGEQAVKQQGEAWTWWKKFAKAILEFVRNLISTNKVDKDTLLKVLTDMFLQRIDLETGEELTTERMKELQQRLVEGIKGTKSDKVETTETEKQEQGVEDSVNAFLLNDVDIDYEDKEEDISQEQDDNDFC